MSVRLIAVSQPVVEEFGTAQEMISYCARVSNPANQLNLDTAPKLLKYCIRKKHWSVFEMAHMVVEIKTTRDIGRQILRHRSFSFQEFSQRYAEVKEDFVLRESRLQDEKNRQASIENDNHELQEEWDIWQTKVSSVAARAYKWALEHKIAKEQARVVLPEGMTPSTMYMGGLLRSWVHFIDTRASWETQKEHRLIAEEIKSILIDQFPFLSEYWKDERKDQSGKTLLQEEKAEENSKALPGSEI